MITDATFNYILGEIDEEGFDQAIADWKAAGGDDVIMEYNQANLEN